MPITKLPRAKGFAQRHFTFREKTPYLKGLDVKLLYRRSGVTLSAIKRDIFKYKSISNYQSLLSSDLDLQLAVHLTDKAFQLHQPVEMLHLNDVFDYDLPIWSSSPGLPWKDQGYVTKGEVIKEQFNRTKIRWFWHNVKTGKQVRNTDCCAFVRSHLTTAQDKVRAVWGYPLTMVLGEAVFAVPLIEAYQKNLSPLAYGYETAIGGMKRIINESQDCKEFAAIDFKDFDKHVQAGLIRTAFNILMRNIDFLHYRDYGLSNVVGIFKMWNHIIEYFINTPIRTCDGNRYQKSSGVASGSYFTQLIDSVINHILITWLYLKQTGRPPKFLKVMGDDSIAGSDFKIDLDLACQLFETIGMTVNFKKSACSNNLHNLTFLGFQINYGLPLKSFDEWVALLCLPEHFDKSWDDVASRALGLLYANNGVEEKFDWLARSIIEIRPFRIHMGKGMARYLKLMGIDYCSKEPPSKFDFARKLKFL